MLRCLVQCSESLQLPATALLEPGMEMVTNTHGTQVILEWDLVLSLIIYYDCSRSPLTGTAWRT